jgi:hypothetical protein
MTKKASTVNTRKSPVGLGYLSKAWAPFAEKLAAALTRLEEDQYLVVAVKDSKRFVQFAAQGSLGMRVETTSNRYLPKPEQLNKKQIATLLEAGWSDPTGSPDESTPENDPDGSPNFFADFPVPVAFASVARLTIQTLAEVMRVPHPSSLQYQAFEKTRQVIALPELGLKQEVPLPEETSAKDLPALLLATLKEQTALHDLMYDGDGDISLQYGSAVVFVRLVGDMPFVRCYSRVLEDIEPCEGILAHLNDLNASEPMVHFVCRGDAIFALADTCAAPFVADHVSQALEHFCAIVDGMDSLLQAQFGGKTAFPEAMPSLLRH